MVPRGRLTGRVRTCQGWCLGPCRAGIRVRLCMCVCVFVFVCAVVNSYARGDNTTSMDYGNGDVAVGQQSTHATRQIQTCDSEDSGLTTGN